MSRSQQRHRLSDLTAIRRLLAASGVAMLLVVGHAGGISAQDGTPMAGSPVATTCDAPTLPPGTPTPSMEGSPAAMPMGSPEATEEVATEAATPEAGTAADQSTAAEITAAVENYAACYNTGDPTKYDALKTANQLTSEYGTSNVYDAIASDQQGPPFAAQLVSVTEQMTYDDGRVSADVQVILAGHMFQHETMYFAQDGDYWKLDQEVILQPEPEGDTAIVGVALGAPDNEYSITPNTDSVTESPVLIFHAINGGKEAHQLVVLQIPEGADPKGLVNGSISFDQVNLVGFVDGVGPGESKDLALVNLPPGTYTMVCFYPSPDGTPHVALGMSATFTVNPAS